jgi:heme-degrading monooxygenase HmoA
MPTQKPGQLAHINIFTPKPGRMDDFINAQLQGLPTLGDIPGSQGSLFYRANDDSHAILIALFEDEASHRRFMETPAFHRHRERLMPLLEGTRPGFYTLTYSREDAPERDKLTIAGAAE